MKQVTFTEEQIKALQEQFSSCIASAQLNGEFSSDAFYGAIECSLKILEHDGYIYLNRYVSEV